MASKLGALIKEARTGAGLTQEKLAKKVGGGTTAADISKAERGELTPETAKLKKIALATGVTQSSLLNAAKASSASSRTKKAVTPAKTTRKKTPDTPASAGISMRVTAAEKKLIEYYRSANSTTKKAASNVLSGKCDDIVPELAARTAAASSSGVGGIVADLLGGVLEDLLNGK